MVLWSHGRGREAPLLYHRTTLRSSSSAPPVAYRWRQILFLFVPLFATIGVLLNSYFGVDHYDTSYQGLFQLSETGTLSKLDDPPKAAIPPPTVIITDNKNNINIDSNKDNINNNNEGNNWCDRVKKAREDLSPTLHIKVPCTTMTPKAISAVVCMLTDGVADTKTTNIIFSATDYIHGAMALGASLKGKIDPIKTHQLLLLREGFVLAKDDMIRLQSVGWTVGTAPNVPLEEKYRPRFPRYRTTYTKISAIGLSEYNCVMLMDADTLAVGDLKDLLTCSIFTESQHRVATTLDLYHRYWHYFNTGSILWRTSSKEMDRVFSLTKDPTWMKAFTSDQDFLNEVYPERLNNTLNWEIMLGKVTQIPGGQVVDMGWRYNAQTHVEVQRTEWWENHRPDVRILHYTQKKGWQCEERHIPPPPLSEMPPDCKQKRTTPICFCRESHLYWNALSEAKALADQALKASNRQETT